jgi:hypothetical protein
MAVVFCCSSFFSLQLWFNIALFFLYLNFFLPNLELKNIGIFVHQLLFKNVVFCTLSSLLLLAPKIECISKNVNNNNYTFPWLQYWIAIFLISFLSLFICLQKIMLSYIRNSTYCRRERKPLWMASSDDVIGNM